MSVSISRVAVAAALFAVVCVTLRPISALAQRLLNVHAPGWVNPALFTVCVLGLAVWVWRTRRHRY